MKICARCSSSQEQIIPPDPRENAENSTERTPGPRFCSLPSLCKFLLTAGSLLLVSLVTGGSGLSVLFLARCYGISSMSRFPWVYSLASKKLTEEVKMNSGKNTTIILIILMAMQKRRRLRINTLRFALAAARFLERPL